MPGTRTLTCPRCGMIHPATRLGGLCPQCLGRSLWAEAVDARGGKEDSAVIRLGDYELGEELGRGAMGAVYRARQTKLNREVALKVILAGEFASEAERKRFLAEAEAAAGLDHPNILPIYDFGEANGRQFFAMKLAGGGTLASNSKLPGEGSKFERAAAMIIKAARAVHHAHQRGVLHRDLKPGNILLDEHGEPQITDFGLARRIGSEPLLTLAGSPVGTPAYMAPEQAAGTSAPTIAADIYSLGAILYELLSGRPPFVGASVAEILREVQEIDPRPPSRVRGADRPETRRSSAVVDLDTICLKCLQKNPAQRYATAEAFAEDLQRWLNGEPIHARPVNGIQRAWQWCRRKPVLVGLVTACVLLVGLLTTGSFVATARLRRAHAQTQEELWRSRLAEARAGRMSAEPGRRARGLATVAQAARFRVNDELRDEAIAHLALFDIEETTHSLTFTSHPPAYIIDSTHQFVAEAVAKSAVHIRRIADGSTVLRWVSPGLDVKSMHFATNSRELAIGLAGDRHGRLNLETGQFLLDDSTGSDPVFTSDGKHRVLRRGPSKLVLLDANGVETGQIDAGHERINGIALGFLSGEFLCAVVLSNRIEVRDWLSSGRRLSLASPEEITSIAWENDYLAAGDRQGEVRLWNLRTGRVRALVGHQGVVAGIDFLPPGDQLATYSWDGRCCVWDAVTGQLLLSTPRWKILPRGASPDTVFLSTASQLAAGRVERATAMRSVNLVDAEFPEIRHMDFSPDGRWLAVTKRAGIYFVEPATGRARGFQPRFGPMSAVFLPGGRMLLVSDRERLFWWRLEENNGGVQAVETRTHFLPGALQLGVGVLGFNSARSQFALPINNREVGLFDGLDPARLKNFSGITNPETAVISPEGRWLAAGTFHGNGLTVFDVATGASTNLHAGNAEPSFSPDGRFLLSAGSEVHRFFDTATWRLVHEHSTGSGHDVAAPGAWSPGGGVVALVRELMLVDLIEAGTWQHLATLTPPQPRGVRCLRFSPDRRTLAVGTDAERVELWDLDKLGAELAALGLNWKLPDALK